MITFKTRWCDPNQNQYHNRPLALSGHASFKLWLGNLLVTKIDRAQKSYLTREIWEETHLRDIVYGKLIFQLSNMICIGHHVGRHALALQHGSQNCLSLVSCWKFDSYCQIFCKCHHIIFSTISLKFKCSIFVQKGNSYNSYNSYNSNIILIIIVFASTESQILKHCSVVLVPSVYCHT